MDSKLSASRNEHLLERTYLTRKALVLVRENLSGKEFPEKADTQSETGKRPKGNKWPQTSRGRAARLVAHYSIITVRLSYTYFEIII